MLALMSQPNVELFALRKLRRRPATAGELETARPLLLVGEDHRATGVLFIHGFTVTPANFHGYAKRLWRQGYTVSVPLLPGHGTRPADLAGVTWMEWLDAVVRAYDELTERCEQVAVCGISLGGSLALQLGRHRRPRKLLLLAPAVFPIPLLKLAEPTLLPALEALGVDYWIHVAGDVRRPEGFELGYGKTPIDGLVQLCRCMRATGNMLPEVTADVLIFQSKIDHEIDAGKAPEILRLLGSQHKELVWLHDSFHEIPRDHDAERVYRRIEKEMAAIAEVSQR